MQRPTKFIHFVAPLICGALLSMLHIKTFEAWDQVTDLWDSGVSPLLLAVIGHPHFFRFLTAYPGFLLEGILPTVGFSLYISVYFAANVALWRHLTLLLAGRAPSAAGWLVFLAAHLFMNGRGVIAWTGWLICVLVCVRLIRGDTGGVKPLLLVALSCWLAAVSTGVFIVVVMALLFFYLQFRRRARVHIARKIVIFAVTVPLLFYVGEYLILAIKKNIDFFGGGIDGVIHMLAHGLGRVLFGSDILAVCLIALAAFLLLFLVMFVRMRKRSFTPLEQLLGYAIFGGLFGLTVLTLAVPIFLIYQQVRRAARGTAPALGAVPA